MNRAAHIVFLVLCLAYPARALETADLDKQIVLETDYRGRFIALCKRFKSGCGIEIGREGERRLSDTRIGHEVSTTTPREVLEREIREKPGFKWNLDRGSLVLLPAKKQKEDLLSKKIGKLSVKQASGFFASLKAFQSAGIKNCYQIMGKAPVFKPLDLDLENMTVRQALNEISKADGEFVWVVAYPSPEATVTCPNFLVVSWRKEGVGFSLDERKRIRP